MVEITYQVTGGSDIRRWFLIERWDGEITWIRHFKARKLAVDAQTAFVAGGFGNVRVARKGEFSGDNFNRKKVISA